MKTVTTCYFQLEKMCHLCFYRISCVIDSENSNQFNTFTTILKSKLLVTQIQRLANMARITFSRVFKVSLFIESSQYVKLKRSNNSEDSEPFQLPHTIYCHYAEILTSHSPWLRLWGCGFPDCTKD